MFYCDRNDSSDVGYALWRSNSSCDRTIFQEKFTLYLNRFNISLLKLSGKNVYADSFFLFQRRNVDRSAEDTIS